MTKQSPVVETQYADRVANKIQKNVSQRPTDAERLGHARERMKYEPQAPVSIYETFLITRNFIYQYFIVLLSKCLDDVISAT